MEVGIKEDSWAGLADMQEALRCFLLRRCADPNELDDVVQETLLRASRYRTRLTEGARLKPWTMRIAINVLADGRRRGWKFKSTADEEETLDEEARDPREDPPMRIGRFEIARSDAVGVLRRSMEVMRDDDRRLLSTFYDSGESCRSVATQCDIPAHLVKIRLFRARRRLCRAMRHRIALENKRPATCGASS